MLGQAAGHAPSKGQSRDSRAPSAAVPFVGVEPPQRMNLPDVEASAGERWMGAVFMTPTVVKKEEEQGKHHYVCINIHIVCIHMLIYIYIYMYICI